MVAGGRPRWLAVPGGRGATAAASKLAYLLLNFSGCFSLITWNLWAMEASWKQKKAEAWLVVVAMRYDGKEHTYALLECPNSGDFQVTAAQRHV